MKLSNEAKIGIAVVAAAVVLIGGIIFLRGIDLRTKQYSLKVLYRNVNGLQEGSLVKVAGLTIGNVESMKLVGRDIAVNLSLQEKVHLPRDSKAIIKSESIMGGKFIEITPGSAGFVLQDGDSLTGMYEADLSELTATLAPISSNMLGILENVNTTFDEKTRKSIQNIIVDINRSSAVLERLIRTEAKQFELATVDIRKFSGSLSHAATDLDSMAEMQSANIDSTMYSIRKITRNLDRLSADMITTTNSLDVVLRKMKNGEGTLGKLVHDDNLYNNLDSLSWNLNLLVKDLRENPGRYVKVSVF